MARFADNLEKWLEKIPDQPSKKRPRRAVESDCFYEDQDPATEDESKDQHEHHQHYSVTRDVKKATTTKRAKHHGPEAPGGEGRKFACPFCQHNPAKYRTVKTCCGPGWDSVHRVKEHIYRRHSLKNTCPRCYEQFKTDDDLKSHQRAETPCRLRKDNVPEVITDEQDKKLHARAKPGLSEEDKWNDMYRIIFPGPVGSKIPSPCTSSFFPFFFPISSFLPFFSPLIPFSSHNMLTKKQTDYDTSAPSSSPSNQSNTTNPSPKNKRASTPPTASNFDISSFKDLLRRELPRYVEPIFRQELDKMMTSVQTQMNQKADQLFKDVVFKFSRTYAWPATTGAAGAGDTENDSVAVITPLSSPCSPSPDRCEETPNDTGDDGHRDGAGDAPAGVEEVAFPGGQSWFDSFVETIDPDSLGFSFYKNGEFNLEACYEEVMNSAGEEIPDSAYGTLPTSEGQHGSYGLGLGMGMAGMTGMTGVMGSNLDAWMR
ncbi:hypothetical protein B0T09DRAFT_252886 [Sordaria sp. MPI-SDFR-AT-0083]|nr:hypothetical protein B0T09DRAFT_252886 [Sordaria sp. MPI-SDFR-AT-0083]